MEHLTYYGTDTPEVGQIVFAKVKKISDISVTCELVEYGGKEAMIPSTELSRRRIKSIHSLVRVGKLEPAVVLRTEGGYIDLSRKKVDKDELAKAEQRFYSRKKLLSVLHHYSQVSGKDFHDLVTRVAHKGEGTEEELAFIKQKFVANSKRLYRCTFTANYYGPEGIEAMKGVFAQSKIPVKYLSAPLYSIELECVDESEGCEALLSQIKVMKDALEAKGGVLEVKQMPYVANKSVEEEAESENEEGELENEDV